MPSRKRIDPRADRQLAQDRHKRSAETRHTWEAAAAQLERAADLLWDQAELDAESAAHVAVGEPVPQFVAPVALLLAGFAVENLLKGYLITQKPALNAAGHFAHKTHDLLELVEQVQVSITAGEHDLLERLEVFSTWAGRYPIPLAADDLLPRTSPGGGFAPLTYSTGSDREMWRGLMAKLRASLAAP